MKCYFLAKVSNGGIGDKFVGILTAMTFSKIFDLELVVLWQDPSMKSIFENVEMIQEKSIKGIHVRLMNIEKDFQKNKKTIHSWKPNQFQSHHLILETNVSYDAFCYDVEWMKQKLPPTYQENTKQNLTELFTKVLIPKIKITEKYDLGIQIRTGDVHFGRKQDSNIIQIPKHILPEIYTKINKMLEKENPKTIYVTCDREETTKELINNIQHHFPQIIINSNLIGTDYHTDKKINQEGMIHCISSMLHLANANTHIILRSNFGIVSANISVSLNNKTGKTYLFDKNYHIDKYNVIVYPHDSIIMKEYKSFPNIKNNFENFNE